MTLGRAAYADALAEAVGINTVLNLSDSDEAIKGYIASQDFDSDYYKSLYDAGKIKALDMGVDVAGDDFGKKLAEGLRFLINNSSSPVNNELGRASYADNLIKEAKVNTVVNLADSTENVETYLASEDFASPYYAQLA